MSKILWTVFEVLINFYQGAVITYFVYSFLSAKSIKTAKSLGLICALLMGAVITALNYIAIFEGMGTVLYWVIIFLYSCIAFKDNPIKKVFSTIVPLVIMFLITSINLNLFSSFNNISVGELVTTQNLQRFLALMSIQVSYLICVIIVLKLFKFATEKFSLKDWIPVISVLLVSILLVAVLHMLSLNAIDTHKKYINLAYLLILIINLVVFWVIYSLFKKNQELNKLEILKLQERYQKQYIDNANIQYNSIRKIKHDLKNQLSTIYTLMSTNKVDAAIEFINKNAQVISNTETFVMTESHVVNAILNSKFATATTFGINVSCLTVSDFSGIDDIDICNLLSNALDNSLTACMNIADDNEKSISVEISKENDIYTFLIRNSINNSVMESNPDLLTTKKEKENHGFGTQIIKDIAQKYNGRCDFYEDEKNFYCQVLLKSTSKSST